MIYFQLFMGFLKVGCFSFGGAYGAIPLIRNVVLSYGWLEDETFTYFVAVSESTPGPIMVNLATYIGSSQAGFLGAVLATLAVVLPSFLLILAAAAFLKTMITNPYVQALLGGIKPCIIGIVLATGIFMVLKNCFYKTPMSIQSAHSFRLNTTHMLITAGLILIAFVYKQKKKKNLSPITLILLSAVAGIFGGL